MLFGTVFLRCSIILSLRSSECCGYDGTPYFFDPLKPWPVTNRYLRPLRHSSSTSVNILCYLRSVIAKDSVNGTRPIHPAIISISRGNISHGSPTTNHLPPCNTFFFYLPLKRFGLGNTYLPR